MTYDPTVLLASGYWRANYGGDPWSATATSGTSSFTGSLDGGSSGALAPTVGASQNSKTPAEYDGATLYQNNATDASTLFTTTAATIVCLFRASAAPTATGNIYDDPAIYCDANADFGLTFTASGIAGFAYDGGYQTQAVACGTGAYHLVRFRIDGANLGITLDNGSEQTVSCSTLAVLTGGVQVGQGYAGLAYFGGRILELMLLPTVLSDADYVSFGQYCQTVYALSLGFPGASPIDAAITGSGAITATLTGTGALAAATSSTGNGNVLATLTGSGALASSLSGTSTVTAALPGTGALASTLSGTGALTATCVGTGALAAAISGTGNGNVTATLTGTGELASSLTGSAAVTCAIVGSGRLIASLSGTCVVHGAMNNTVVRTIAVRQSATPVILPRGVASVLGPVTQTAVVTGGIRATSTPIGPS